MQSLLAPTISMHKSFEQTSVYFGGAKKTFRVFLRFGVGIFVDVGVDTIDEAIKYIQNNAMAQELLLNKARQSIKEMEENETIEPNRIITGIAEIVMDDTQTKRIRLVKPYEGK